MLTEIVRLPVGDDADALLAFLKGHGFFAQDALLDHRFFRAEDETEVMVLITWRSREDMQATTDNEYSTRFREDLAPLLGGPPSLTFYVAAG